MCIVSAQCSTGYGGRCQSLPKGISPFSQLEPSTCWCPLPYVKDRQFMVAVLVGAGGHVHRLDTPTSRVEVRRGGGAEPAFLPIAGSFCVNFSAVQCDKCVCCVGWSWTCSCLCFHSQKLNSNLKSEPIIWKHMVVNVAGTMVAMVDDKGYIWMGSSDLKVGPLTTLGHVERVRCSVTCECAVGQGSRARVTASLLIVTLPLSPCTSCLYTTHSPLSPTPLPHPSPPPLSPTHPLPPQKCYCEHEEESASVLGMGWSVLALGDVRGCVRE